MVFLMNPSRVLCVFAISIARASAAASANISVLAGSGYCWTYGDGDQLHEWTSFNTPSAVCVDTKGFIYVAETQAHYVRVVRGGYIEAYAGVAGWYGSFGNGGFATQAGLNSPSDVFCHPNGNIYIAGTGAVASPGTEDFRQLRIPAPFFPAFDVDTWNHAIRAVIPAYMTAIGLSSPTMVTFAGALGDAGATGDGLAATLARLSAPHAIVFDSPGNAYIVDAGNAGARH